MGGSSTDSWHDIDEAYWYLSAVSPVEGIGDQIPILISPFRVGRDPQSALWLRNNKISKAHAQLEFAGDELLLSDLGSTNGTFVNAQPIASAVSLNPGDVVHFYNIGFDVRHWRQMDPRTTQKASPRRSALELEIAHRCRAQNACNDSETTSQAILAGVDEGILTFDHQGEIETINPAACRLFACAAHDAVGQAIEVYLPEIKPEAFRNEACFDGFSLETDGLIGGIHRSHGRRTDDEKFPCEYRVSIVPLSQRRIYVAVVRDITAEEAAQQELHQARRLAESASRTKGEFLANMSHEIRTPMTAILGFAEDLLDEETPQDDRAIAVQTIRRNGRHLMKLVNDILDLSKIEAGKIEVERRTCSLVEIIHDVVTVVKPRGEEKKLPVRLLVASPLPEKIATDPTRLRQILINLLVNAVKFTDQGSVELRVSYSEGAAGPGCGRLWFDVIDTGIGISKKECDRVFSAFSQADATTTRQHGGVGLGLAISKQLAELLGGTIEVSSTVGDGSTFRVTLTLKDAPPASVTPQEAMDRKQTAKLEETCSALLSHAGCQGLHVLLAEDGPDNQRLISLVLKKAGAKVTSAVNGQEAIDAATKAQQNQCPFDVILMDMQMPVMDGYTAAARLRELGCKQAIIALTANAMKGDRTKCLEAGCNDYCAKPIDRVELIRMVAKWGSRRKCEERVVRLET